MEIMGLVIIVILISISMIFVIRFVIMEEPGEFKKEFTQKQLSANFVNTLLGTTNAACHNLNFRELIQDCVGGEEVCCKYTSSCIETSCQFLKGETNSGHGISNILKGFLDTKKIRYYFSVKDGMDNIKEGLEYSYNNQGHCPGGKFGKPFAVPTDSSGANIVLIKLDICS